MLPANSLNAILISNAYHEFKNYMEMLDHMKKSLKPGGRLAMAELMEKKSAGASREQQMDDHCLAMKFGLKDLEKAGFKIVNEVEEFFNNNDHNRYWMIIAERPSQ